MRYKIITINREFSSGGSEIGQKVAEALEIPYIDNFLIKQAAVESGQSVQHVLLTDEVLPSRFEYSQAEAANYYGSAKNPTPTTARIAEVQFQLIRELAEKGPCLIVGRCGNYVLRERTDVLSVFINAGFERRVRQTMEQFSMKEKAARKLVARTDKNRKAYYKNYTGMDWNDPDAYHIALNSDLFGTELCVKLICDAYQGI